MSLNSKQAFKAGFLLRCAAEGLDTEQTQARVKFAAEVTKSGGAGGGVAGSAAAVASTIARLGLWAPFLSAGSGALAGHFGGRLLSDLKDSSTSGRPHKASVPEEIKATLHEELLDAYEQHAHRARRRAATLRRKREKEEEAGPAYF
tara:strand:- start:603 stop:1043 length:441 start_codon:yes stop_codon:yes gene_type:complete